ncbi:type I restriction endonuclease [Pseudoxanthomonas taiwanensis]|uniref:Type I restriction endonuclease n=1 Tax=Pseudoxanthomonas taiwanensis TaxID=176598 RepID=A0A921NV85_9GAMM|nr:type I restriction endonuclease [Pseudoxanthomonas taiwanensis]KAF1688662.1 type I restriction endonuclease [Pseudoxanthomonas taiwanensis]
MAFLSEAAVEQALLNQLRALGYSVEREDDIGPDGHRPERESHDEVVLRGRFEHAVERLNPAVPPEARQDAIRRGVQAVRASRLDAHDPHGLISGALRISDAQAFLKERDL